MDEPSTPWKALRLVTGLSGREVERRLGWKSGHISLIERGIRPTAQQEDQLRQFYAAALPGALLRTGAVGDAETL
jgi:transcriptional regulator with XRE-family HTH domain